MTVKHTETVTATPQNLTGVRSLVDSRGRHLAITGEVYASSTSPGMTAVEVEHGTLYVDADETVTVATPALRPLTRPVAPEVLRKKYGVPSDEDAITVSILVSLDDLLDGDIEHLNNIADYAIVRSHASLMDLAYEVTGHQDGQIVLTVTADASDIWAEHLCIHFEECEGLIDNGEGFDGECGDCADRTYAAEHADEDDEDEDGEG